MLSDMLSDPLKAVERFVEAKARPFGIDIVGRDISGGRKVQAFDKGGETCFTLEMRTGIGGFQAWLVRPRDHVVDGMPHRTGDKGTLEPIRERIVLVRTGEIGDWSRINTLLEAEVARVIGVRAAQSAEGPEAASVVADRIGGLYAADPEAARNALAGALVEALDPVALARLSQAVERHVSATPAPRLG